MVVCCFGAGCKFGRLTNAKMDCVDSWNDAHQWRLDRFYNPATDLTRAGKDDWCRAVRPCVAKRTCLIREGAQDVPQPGYVVYPQPPELDLDAGYTAGSSDPSDVMPPEPEDQ